MDLQVSYNWLNEYLKSSKPVEQFARDFSLKSQTVDHITDMAKGLEGVVVGQLVEVSKHPNADRLNVAKVDIGRKEHLNLIFGQMITLKVGDKLPVAVAPTVLPTGQEIKKSDIRGVASEGMFCLVSELGFSRHEVGIFFDETVKPGTPLVDALKLKDYLLDIEVTSNRPDAMSIVGLAREASAALGVKFNFREPKVKIKKLDKEIDLAVEVRDTKTCPRYQTAVMTDFQVGPSPLWLQMRLISIGFKPINNLVDITNYIAFEYGQPMHVFDYDKIEGRKIIVRKAKTGESIKALDDQTYKLKNSHLVIADAKKPIAIGGVMGGFDSAATGETKTLVFECANFDPVSIRKTSRELNLYSDSSSRYEKGLHPEGVALSMARAIELAKEVAGAKMASNVTDIYEVKKYKPPVIKLDLLEITRYLGVDIPAKKVKEILESLGFSVSGSKSLKVAVPWWRANDVLASHDLIEEIARIYGYDKLPEELPDGKLPKQNTDKKLYWEKQAKEIFSGLGFTEVYNYSFVSKAVLEKVGFSADKALPVSNELSEDMKYMRTSLLPQLLENVSANLNNFSSLQIFELSNVYRPKDKDLPEEISTLSGAIVMDEENSFFQAKGAVDIFLKKMGVRDYRFAVPDFQSLIWDKNKYLDVFQGDDFLGQLGILSRKIAAKFDINKPVTLFDFSFEKIAKAASTVKTYRPIPEFPAIFRDLAVVVDKQLMFQELVSVIKHELIQVIEYKETFIGRSVGEGKKSILLSIEFRSAERTLQSSEVDEIMKEIASQLEQKFKATIR